MESRKIQFTGKSTFVISLPKRWIRSKNLSAGDSIYIEEMEDGTLSINPLQAIRREEVSRLLDISKKSDKELERAIIAEYIRGFDILKIVAKGRISPSQRAVINKILQKLVGPEVLEETSGHLLIKDLLDMSELSPRNILRRMYLISQTMLKNSVDAFFDGNREMVEDVISRDTEVDKLYLLVSRELTESVRKRSSLSLGVNPEQSLQYLAVAKSLERIADHAVKIAYSSVKDIKMPGKLIEDLQKLYKKSMYVMEVSSTAFFGLDEKAANKALNSKEKIQQLVSGVVSDVEETPSTTIKLFTIIDSLQRVAGYSTDIAEGALNLRSLRD